jgi:hypothetical protein
MKSEMNGNCIYVSSKDNKRDECKQNGKGVPMYCDAIFGVGCRGLEWAIGPQNV